MFPMNKLVLDGPLLLPGQLSTAEMTPQIGYVPMETLLVEWRKGEDWI